MPTRKTKKNKINSNINHLIKDDDGFCIWETQLKKRYDNYVGCDPPNKIFTHEEGKNRMTKVIAFWALEYIEPSIDMSSMLLKKSAIISNSILRMVEYTEKQFSKEEVIQILKDSIKLIGNKKCSQLEMMLMCYMLRTEKY